MRGGGGVLSIHLTMFRNFPFFWDTSFWPYWGARAADTHTGGFHDRKIPGMVGTCEAEYGLVGAFFQERHGRPRSFGGVAVKGQETNPLLSFPCSVLGFMRMTVYWVVH